MRLTLRTLLAYLDDTLEPSQAKLIGQKVAESDTAQELIARIKEVTRRRRLTTPSNSGPGAKVDPNSIAEYLDNELSAEQLAEVEQLALSSDVHLAEIAACHQILTLVLGEQALVPPTAFKRMYGLVKPPESNPNQQPPARRGMEDAGLHESRDVDETLRLGLPALTTGSWTNRLILAGGAAAVFLLLALAIWQILPPTSQKEEASGTTPRVGTIKPVAFDADTPKKDKATSKVLADTKSNSQDDANLHKATPTKDKDTPKDTDKDTAADKDWKAKDKSTAKEKEEPPPAPPDPTVRDIAIFEQPMGSPSAVLLQMQPDKKSGMKQWTRLLLQVKDPTKVVSNSPLLSLPGYKSVILLDSGVRLTLWGNIPEQALLGWESLVVLHPSDKFDVDLTLRRGRIVIANPKDQPVKVRVRFDNPANPKKGEVWDVTLQDKGTEVVLMLLSYIPPGEPFYPDPANTNRLGPIVDVVALAQTGKAILKVGLNAPVELAPPNDGSMHRWNSRQGPQDIQLNKGLPPWLTATGPVKRGFADALDALNKDLASPSQSIEAVLLRAINSNDVYKSRQAVRCDAAVDDIQRLIGVLKDHKDKDVRWEAKEMLLAWISTKVDDEYVLFDTLQQSYAKGEAEIFMQLLRHFSGQQLQDPNIYQALIGYLGNRKIAIRELAYYHLWHVVPEGRNIPHIQSALEDQVRTEVLQWQKLIPQGTVPPAPK
jgi:hypothetical protein